MPSPCSPIRAPSARWATFQAARLHQRRPLSTPRRTQFKHSSLLDTPARTRFAPSPTGALHLGSVRTALFNYMLAKKTGGQFLLRLEDTDARRTVPGAEQQLYQDLRWAGLNWDEGPEVDAGDCGPYRQSERTAIYREHAEKLLGTSHAYRCFCSAERLDALAAHRRTLGLPTDYDRTCASLTDAESDERVSRGDSFVVRLRAPEQYPAFDDLVYGRVGAKRGSDGAHMTVTHKHGETAYEDPVLLKSDGHPTYHLANVVDDHLMRITHVVRATEWLPSTPKHLALYAAFGWQPPAFAHVGLLVDADGQKLSKRRMDASIAGLRDQGILPAALLNFAALLGWSHGRSSDVMTLEDLVAEFRPRFTKGNAVVGPEKLAFLQRAHVTRVAALPPGDREREALLDIAAQPFLDAVHASTQDTKRPQALVTGDEAVRARVAALLLIDARNYAQPGDFLARNIGFIFPVASSVATENAPLLAELAEALFGASVLDWSDAKALDHVIRSSCLGADGANASAGREDAHPADPAVPLRLQTPEQKRRYRAACTALRGALLGGREGPGVASTLMILGRDESRARVQAALDASADVDGAQHAAE